MSYGKELLSLWYGEDPTDEQLVRNSALSVVPFYPRRVISPAEPDVNNPYLWESYLTKRLQFEEYRRKFDEAYALREGYRENPLIVVRHRYELDLPRLNTDPELVVNIAFETEEMKEALLSFDWETLKGIDESWGSFQLAMIQRFTDLVVAGDLNLDEREPIDGPDYYRVVSLGYWDVAVPDEMVGMPYIHMKGVYYDVSYHEDAIAVVRGFGLGPYQYPSKFEILGRENDLELPEGKREFYP